MRHGRRKYHGPKSSVGDQIFRFCVDLAVSDIVSNFGCFSGTSAVPVQENLRWGCDVKKADEICNFNRVRNPILLFSVVYLEFISAHLALTFPFRSTTLSTVDTLKRPRSRRKPER